MNNSKPKSDKKDSKRGFTLIELLVVISIISLLSSVVFASVNSARAKTRDAKRLSDFRQFENALSLYYDTFAKYPCGDNQPNPPNPSEITYDSSLSSPFLDGEEGSTSINSCIGEPKKGIFTNKYYPVQWPLDPINKNPGWWSSGNYGYGYDASNNRQQYLLYTRLETNNLLMSSDGGKCNFLYEKGPGLGVMTPQLAFVVGEKCN